MSGAIIGGTMDFVQQFNGGYDIDYDRLNQAVTSGMVSGAIGGAVMGAFSGGLQGLKSAKLLRKNNPKVNVKDSQKTINKDTKKSFEQTAKKQTSVQQTKYKAGMDDACVVQNKEILYAVDDGSAFIPDEIHVSQNKRLSYMAEVKNTTSLYKSRQFRKYFAYSLDKKENFILHVRVGTKMSKPLLEGLIEVGSNYMAKSPTGMLVFGKFEIIKDIFYRNSWGNPIIELVEILL